MEQKLVEQTMVEKKDADGINLNDNVDGAVALATRKDRVKALAKRLAKRWFIDGFSGMALGLFCTLIAGTILEQIGKLIGENILGYLLVRTAYVAKVLMGAGIGGGIAYMLKADRLTIFSAIVAGMIGANAEAFYIYNLGDIVAKTSESLASAPFGMAIGNPIGAYLTSIFTVELCRLYAGKTKLDIILIPIGAFVVTLLVAISICPPVTWLIRRIGDGIVVATAWSPFIMGIVISVVMGVLLTMPTSSAAIWVAIALGNTSDIMLLAGGAAVAGCCAHMVGFAAMSFKENGFGGLIAQGLGTSMLQIPNIMKNPWIILPPIVASAVVGPISTCVFFLRCGASGGGMGTAGLVGIISVIDNSVGVVETWRLIVGIVICLIILPAVLSIGATMILKKLKLIGEGDLKLQL